MIEDRWPGIVEVRRVDPGSINGLVRQSVHPSDRDRVRDASRHQEIAIPRHDVEDGVEITHLALRDGLVDDRVRHAHALQVPRAAVDRNGVDVLPVEIDPKAARLERAERTAVGVAEVHRLQVLGARRQIGDVRAREAAGHSDDGVIVRVEILIAGGQGEAIRRIDRHARVGRFVRLRPLIPTKACPILPETVRGVEHVDGMEVITFGAGRMVIQDRGVLARLDVALATEFSRDGLRPLDGVGGARPLRRPVVVGGRVEDQDAGIEFVPDRRTDREIDLG